jgi:Lamin Tail Domain/Concanavalin A-like lectin/glucanases superfamily/CotH kinase protein
MKLIAVVSTFLFLGLAGSVRADSTVVFNEIMYHPQTNEAALEWVELYNQMSVDMDLSGWSLDGGIGFDFPEGTLIRGGGYLVVSLSPATLMAATGLTNVYGPFSGRLSNAGEELRLLNNNQRVMDTVDYGVDGDWPAGADGAGASLAKRDPDKGSEAAENWTLSAPVGGTPGVANFPRTRTVRTSTFENLLPINATWKFNQSGIDLGALWRAPDFDDSLWPSGPALLGLETAGLPEPLQTPLELGPTTYYFRTTFDYAGDPAQASLSITHIVDDGMVVYLNGVEVWRVGMAPGAVAFSDFASRGVVDAVYEGPFTIPSSNLVAGANVVAVEVHQTSATSSDVVFGLSLDEVKTVEVSGPDFEIPDGLVSYWDFNAAGTVVIDLAGGNAGTLGAGASSGAGIIGSGAMMFDGTTNAYVDVGPGQANNFAARDGIAIEALMAPGWDGTGSASVFRKEEIITAGGPLISYWSFDEAASGTATALDPAGGNNGNFIGTATRTTGLTGTGAAQFNNSGSDGVNVGAGVDNAFSVTTGLTVFARIRPQWSGNSGDYDEIFRKEDGGNRILLSFQNDANNGGANPPVPPGPVLSFGLNVGGYGELDMPLDGAEGRPTLAQLKDGNTHAVAAVYDSATGLKAIYIDGTLRHSVTLAGQIQSGGGASAVIGNTSTSGGEPFTGVIDEVALWRTALDGGQIMALAAGESPLNVSPGTATNQSTRILFEFQNDGHNAEAIPPVPDGPVLSFGLNVGGDYSELDMPLDGLNGRPTLDALRDGSAHHVAATYDAGTGRKAIYIDGSERFATLLSGRITSGGSGSAILGNTAVGGLEPFSGPLDEMAFWNRALSDAEIQKHFNAFQAGLGYFASTSQVVRTTLAFNELSASTNNPFWLEIVNFGSAPVELEGHLIEAAGAAGGVYVFPAQTLAPGGLLEVTESELGFHPSAGNAVSLFTPGRLAVLDSVVIRSRLQGRQPQATGPWLYPNEPTPGAPNAFALHNEIVINEIMYNHVPISAQDATYGPDTPLLTISNAWRFNQEGIDLGSAWRNPDFDDSAWAAGDALFYVTASALPAPKNTPLSLTDAGGARKVTFYFRTEFMFDGSRDGLQLGLRPIVDDGAVFYLNGVEVFRLNMPAGDVAYSTVASANVGIPGFTGPFVIPASSLVQGRNVLAVEVHQVNAFSGDVVFGTELLAAEQLTPAVPYSKSSESWLELYNRGSNAVDLAGWSLDGGIDYPFAPGQILNAGDYLVVAKDVALMQSLYPALNLAGPFEKNLSHSSDRIILKDAQGNPADDVRYFDGGRWPEFAKGGGSSLELRDPNADNAVAESWAASDEGGQAAWQTITYRGIAASEVSPPAVYNEFVIGLLDAGEVLLDDIRVTESPDTAPVQLIQNGSFETGLGAWRIIGDHAGSVVTDPDNPGNHVLRLAATGPTEHLHNHAETTLKNGSTYVSVVNGREYEISLRAKWLGGSRLLNTRLWFNRLARTTPLEVPPLNGTPGARNSRYEPNIGPAFTRFFHRPVVPQAGQEVTVSAEVNDPHGVAGVDLYWSADGGAWNSVAMNRQQGTGAYAAVIPGYSSGAIVQFYARAQDGPGAVSTFPAAGPDSRALYKVEDGQAILGLAHNVRIIMTAADTDYLLANTNLMSNGRLGATVIYDENEVFYDAGVRLKGSEHGRADFNRLGFNVEFPPGHLFRDVHQTVAIDRSGGWRFGTTFGQDEILIKHIINHAGNLPGVYDDLIRVIAPRSQFTGSAIMQMARFGGVFLDSQYKNGGDGTDFEYELFYGESQTTGGPEGLKIPQEGGVSGVPISDLGDDKENYRLAFIIKNNRDQDDYSKLMAAAKAVGLPAGAQFHAETAKQLDVDEWLRAYALSSLVGPGDNYGGDNAHHNLYLYTRPGVDEKTLYFIFDTDFSFFLPATDSITRNTDLQKFLTLPDNLRRYYGHLYEIITTTYNTAYMAYWTDHYDNFLPGQNFSSILTYIGQRANYVLGLLPTQTPFAITSNGGNDFTSPDNVVTLSGTAPIQVKFIEVNGVRYPLTWTSATGWTVSLALPSGPGALTFNGVDFRGAPVPNASDAITVTVDQEAADPADFVVLNEIMYNPLVPDTAFVEVHNTHPTVTFDLSNWRLDGADFIFPPGSFILPGGFLVAVNKISAFTALYGPSVPVAGQFDGRLENGGEILRLVEPGSTPDLDRVVDEVRYDDDPPWPAAANGSGPSLQVIDPTRENNRVANWAVSAQPPLATPGATNSVRADLPPFPPLWINELQVFNVTGLMDNAGERDPWVELFNAGSDVVLLDGFFLTDNFSNLTEWPFPPGSAINPGQFLLVWADGDTAQTTAADLHASFRLTGSSGSVGLVRTNTGRVEVLDHIHYFGLTADHSFGSFPDGQPENRQLFHFNTPGGPNNAALPPVPVVINEWMADNAGPDGYPDPADGLFQDWFELYNPNVDPFDLSNYYLSDDPNQPGKWQIPLGTVVPPGGFLLVWADNQPEENGTSPGGDLHVNFQLNSGGETVGLFAPDHTPQSVVTFGPQFQNVSEGLFPDGNETGGFQFMRNFSPRSANRSDGGAGSIRALIVAQPGGFFTLSWNSALGRSYRVDYKNSLQDPGWNTLLDAIPGTGSTVSVNDNLATSPQRFYRIVEMP